MEKPHLLYLSPVVPSSTGNGLAMRAASVLHALVKQYDVSLLVIPVYSHYDGSIPSDIVRICQAAVVIPQQEEAKDQRRTRWLSLLHGSNGTSSSSLADRAADAFRGVPFDVIHVFRLAMVQFAQPYLTASPAPTSHLDLDDIESETHRSLAALHDSNGDSVTAAFEAFQAEQYEAAEEKALQEFDRIYVCSDEDRQKMEGRGRSEICVVPNGVPVRAITPLSSESDPYTFLFVGTLSYYPNEDAVRYFCLTVLPLLRERTARRFSLSVVGSGATPALAELAGLPDLQIVGAVPDMAPWYRAADAVVVPIRAGGGTRIKVLEAMSYWRPIASTRIGVRGIGVQHGHDVLLADTPMEFADECARLMDNPPLGRKLVQNANSLFMRAYTVEAQTRRILSLSVAELPPESRSAYVSPFPM